MELFIGGILVGIAIFAIIAAVNIFNKMQTEMVRLNGMVDNVNKINQLLLVKLNKIEKVTDATMIAAETFVDALRTSAEQMIGFRPLSRNGESNQDVVDDLRRAFDDGIRGLEDNINDNDDMDEEEGPEEPWKKK